MLRLAFRSLVCAIVVYVSLAEVPKRGHGHAEGQLQAEVSEDGKIMMHEAKEPPAHHETEIQGHVEEPAHQETELQGHEAEEAAAQSEHEEKPAEATELHGHEAEALSDGQEGQLLEEEHEEEGSELADGEVEIFSKWGRRRRRRRRRRAIPCVWHNWGAWTACNKGCGGGITFRTRGVRVKPLHGGRACTGPAREQKACNTHHCPINCVWKPFGAWGKCSKTCAGGVQKRSRGFAKAAAHGGKACAGAKEESKKCNEQPCPVDCVYGEWGEWDKCSVTCGNGTRKHTREVETEAAHGGDAILPAVCRQFTGKECEGEPEEEGPCDPPPEKCGTIHQAVGAILLALTMYLW